MKLQGKVAVVTGGGRGIGAAVARDLAADGARIVVSARSKDQIEKVAEELREAGHEAWAVTCDVADPEQVAELAAETEALAGPADILVNNAGIGISARLAKTRLEDWNRIFAVNVTGTFLCTKAFLPGMLENGWGRIVNVASIAGRMGAPYITAYCSSKHAVVGFTRALAAEVAKTGVTVNAVCPGYVATDMMESAVKNIVARTGLDEKAARGHLEAMSPQGRVFEAEEVSHLVRSLCDPMAGGVNAQALVLDGGAVQA